MDIGTDSTLIFGLALATLVIVLVGGLYQRHRARRAKETNEHSALMDHGGGTDKRPSPRK